MSRDDTKGIPQRPTVERIAPCRRRDAAGALARATPPACVIFRADISAMVSVIYVLLRKFSSYFPSLHDVGLAKDMSKLSFRYDKNLVAMRSAFIGRLLLQHHRETPRVMR